MQTGLHTICCCVALMGCCLLVPHPSMAAPKKAATYQVRASFELIANGKVQVLTAASIVLEENKESTATVQHAGDVYKVQTIIKRIKGKLIAVTTVNVKRGGGKAVGAMAMHHFGTELPVQCAGLTVRLNAKALD